MTNWVANWVERITLALEYLSAAIAALVAAALLDFPISTAALSNANCRTKQLLEHPVESSAKHLRYAVMFCFFSSLPDATFSSQERYQATIRSAERAFARGCTPCVLAIVPVFLLSVGEPWKALAVVFRVKLSNVFVFASCLTCSRKN